VRSRIARERGALAPIIQAEPGTECTSVALDHWAYGNAVTLAFSRPGTPGDNAPCEAFNGTLRRAVLSPHWLAPLDEARYLLEAWRTDYHNTRSHRS
jgi:putative transposase